jgi:hypothetical protein
MNKSSLLEKISFSKKKKEGFQKETKKKKIHFTNKKAEAHSNRVKNQATKPQKITKSYMK